MAEVLVKIDDTPVRIAFGDDTTEAQRQQLLAKEHADDSLAEANRSQTEADRSGLARDVAVATTTDYDSLALAQAGSVDGDFFVYKDANGLPVYAKNVGGVVSAIEAPWFGSERIGFQQGVAAVPEYLDLVVKRIGFHPQSYGAVGDGVTDDTAALQACSAAAIAANDRMVLKDGEFLFKQQVIAQRIKSDGGKLIVAEDFDDTQVGTNPRSAIINPNWQYTYNPNTALPFEIEGSLEAEVRCLSKHQFLTLLNVSGGAIERPVFYTNTTFRVDALIDIQAAVRDFDVWYPVLLNVTEADGGAEMWIRAITTSPADPESATFNIRVHGGRFTHATGDESLAVYGVVGPTRDVTILGLMIDASDGAIARDHSVLLSAMPAVLTDPANPYYADSQLYAAVERITFDKCYLKDGRFRDHVYRVGKTSDAGHVCRDIVFRNGKIDAKQRNAVTSYMARHVECVGRNNILDNVVLLADGTGQPVTYGAAGFHGVEGGCQIKGNVTHAVSSCERVQNNDELIGLGSGVLNSKKIEGNSLIEAPAYPIQIQSSARSSGKHNTTRSTNTSGSAAMVLFNTLGDTVVPEGAFQQNDYDGANNASARLARISGNVVGIIDIERNRGLGSGDATLSTLLRKASGNDRFGYADPLPQTMAGDADAVLPSRDIQTVVFNTPLTAIRTVTTVNPLNGQRVRVVRTAAATGAFDVTFNGQTLSATGWLEMERINGVWSRVGKGT